MAVKRLELKIYGMDCAEEVAVLKNEVGSLVGHSENLVFALLKGRMTVSLPSGTISTDVILKAVERSGMRAEIWNGDRDKATGPELWQQLQKVR